MYSAAHYWAYTTSGVLHRDISLNNIMWFMRGDELVGVLCDWDLIANFPGILRPLMTLIR